MADDESFDYEYEEDYVVDDNQDDVIDIENNDDNDDVQFVSQTAEPSSGGAGAVAASGSASSLEVERHAKAPRRSSSGHDPEASPPATSRSASDPFSSGGGLRGKSGDPYRPIAGFMLRDRMEKETEGEEGTESRCGPRGRLTRQRVHVSHPFALAGNSLPLSFAAMFGHVALCRPCRNAVHSP